MPDSFVFFGIPFSAENPALNAVGQVVDVGCATDHAGYDRLNIGVAGCGSGPCGHRPDNGTLALFAEGSYLYTTPTGSDCSPLQAKPEWRENLLRFCQEVGIVNPSEPAWYLAWSSD